MAAITQYLFQKNLKYAKKGVIIGWIAGMLWGLGGVIIAMAMVQAPFTEYEHLSVYIVPLVGCCITDLIASVIIIGINIYKGKGKEYLRALKTKPGKIIILASIFGGPVAMSGYYLGMYLSGTFYGLAITATYPALGAILCRIFLKEKMTIFTKIGIVLCVLGAIVVTFVAPDGAEYPYFVLGIIMCLMGCLGWGLEGVICAYGMELIDPDIAIGLRYITSFLVYLFGVVPFVAGFGTAGYSLFIDVFTTNPGTLLIVLIAGIVMAISYYWYYEAINMAGASRTMALMIMYALWGVIFGWVFAGSVSVTANIVLGTIIIFVGAVFVTGKPSELFKLRDN